MSIFGGLKIRRVRRMRTDVEENPDISRTDEGFLRTNCIVQLFFESTACAARSMVTERIKKGCERAHSPVRERAV